MSTSPQQAMRAAKIEMRRRLPKKVLNRWIAARTVRFSLIGLGSAWCMQFVMAIMGKRLPVLSMTIIMMTFSTTAFLMARWTALCVCLEQASSHKVRYTQFNVSALWPAAAHYDRTDFESYYSFFRWRQDPIQAYYLLAVFQAFCKLDTVTHDIARDALIDSILPLNATLHGLADRRKLVVYEPKYKTLQFFWMKQDDPQRTENRDRLQLLQNKLYARVNPYFERDLLAKNNDRHLPEAQPSNSSSQ